MNIDYYIRKGLHDEIKNLEYQLEQMGKVLGRDNTLSAASTEYFLEREQKLIETLAALGEYAAKKEF